MVKHKLFFQCFPLKFVSVSLDKSTGALSIYSPTQERHNISRTVNTLIKTESKDDGTEVVFPVVSFKICFILFLLTRTQTAMTLSCLQTRRGKCALTRP